MTISMIGIDHDRAPVDIRALFAFTKKNAGEAMERLKETAGIYGCIILCVIIVAVCYLIDKKRVRKAKEG